MTSVPHGPRALSPVGQFLLHRHGQHYSFVITFGVLFGARVRRFDVSMNRAFCTNRSVVFVQSRMMGYGAMELARCATLLCVTVQCVRYTWPWFPVGSSSEHMRFFWSNS